MILSKPEPNLAEAFVFPASFAQQRLWFIEQLIPGSSLYLIPLVFRITGVLHRAELAQSFQAMVDRHETLRTSFNVVNGQLAQAIAPKLAVSLPQVNLQAAPASEREALALGQIRQEIQQPFNLKTPPLFRVRLWQLEATEHLLLVLFHHIIFDEWSSGVLIRELGAYYTAFVNRKPVDLEELPIQYADFAHWQRQWLQGDVLNAQLSYWRQQLKDVQALDLPTVAPRTASQSYRGASQLLELPQQLLDALEDLSRQAGVTLFMTLLAAFQTLLHRYTKQTDIAIGSPIANRHRSELEGLIGFLVNSLVLRTDLGGDPSFSALLNRVRDVTLAAYAHQDVPFEKLVEELHPTRSLGQNPLFQVVFALQNTPMEQLELPGLTLSPLEFETQTTRFDLEFYVWKCAGNFRSLWGKGWQQTDGLRGVVIYNTDLFDSEMIAALRRHFQTLLEGVVANPNAPLSTLPLLKPEEQQQIVDNWNTTQTDYSNCCIHELFQEQARRHPSEIAVQFGEQQFTYQELNQGSNQLARYLQKRGITSGMRVGICLERSPEAVAAMLAVLKAGGVYLPLDPSYPLERLDFLLQDAQASVVLTQNIYVDWFEQSHLKQNNLEIICLEQIWNAIASESDLNLSTLSRTNQLAYVMYTSGSTGTPKGVMVPHCAVMRLVCNTNYVQIQPEDRIAQVANLAFDAATFEVWGALLNGARLVGIERETTLNPIDFVTEIRHQQISVMFLTTALLNQTVSQIPDAFRSLKYLLFGGETANPDRVRQVLNHGKPQHLLHVYGPTENTTFSTWYEVRNISENTKVVPIGQAISNTQVYLLDVNLNPVPIGISGEIYLSGDGLAKGYLNRPELTEEKFIHNPFNQEDIPSRLYKTGDLAQYRADGNLEFLGRIDNQVKIRGFRVELGEIESVLMQHPCVEAAVVTVREVEADWQLIAYLVLKVVLDSERDAMSATVKQRHRELREFLKTKLPAYMLPAAFVVLDALPLTPNGKVDQRALPLTLPDDSETVPPVAPTTSLEKALVEIWRQLLGREVGIHDNFFESGGHSLLATQLVSRIRDRLQIEIPLRRVFETPTIAELAQQVEVQSQPTPIDSAIQPAQLTTAPLSFAQQRLWFLDQLAPGNPFYNMSAAIRLQGKLDPAALERAFNEIVRRHAALRTTFTIFDGQAVQVIAPEAKIALSVIDLRSVSLTQRETLTQQFITSEAQCPFDLSTDLLLRVTLLQFDATEAILLLTLHHIVADGWSLGVLVRELGHCYTAFVQGNTPTLPALPIQYADFSEWQRKFLQGEVLETHLAYWRKRLQDLPTLDLPTDRRRPAVQTYRGATYPLHCSPALTQQLVALSQQAGVSLFMTLLAAFQAVLYRYTGQTDIALGSPIANRHHSELEGLIGFFVNSLVLRTDLSGNPTFRALIERVRDVALEAYTHQDLPFEKLVEELDPERDLSRNPLFQVAFALQNAPMQPLELPNLSLSPVHLEPGTTRFDLEVHLWEPAHGLRSLWQSEAGLSGFIAYSTDLFDRDTIQRLVGHLQTLLEKVAADPDARLSDLPILTPAERQQIFDWNQTDSEAPEADANQCFQHLFELQAQHFPDAIALVSQSESLTYGELNERADRLAQILQRMGVQSDFLVGLCVDRSAEMVVGILGIWKAGGAYVPLDPSYPRDRLQFMLTDTQVRILLTQSWLVESLPPSQADILCLDQCLEQPLEPDVRADRAVTPDHLAYVIYTSGSTGTPKGVLIPHRGLSNVVEAQRRLFGSSQGRVLQFSSISFDASIFEMALAFGSGGTLYIPPQSAQLPGTALIQFLQNNAITHALLTPSVLSVLPSAELPTLQTLITGGEACSSQVVDRWAANRRFYNAYGPTETSIWATVAELYPGNNPLIIGRPVANTQVYILDHALDVVPIGVSGEIYIGGEGIAHGYLNRPKLTVEKFILHPIFNSCLYKTGDRARYRSDGTIEFLGRIDTQIKFRGFRVELGEIEATLQRHPAVQDAVTIAAGDADHLRLIAYFSLNLAYIQETGLTEAFQTQQIQHWQTLYHQTYEPNRDSDFNITGWNSSYTGQPIPLEQMREWVADRVQQLLTLRPQRVLEIGCGTGLLLFQIAPHCQQYWGTDFSVSSLASIQRQLADYNLSHVTLLHRTATEFEGIDPATFDLVILNSVVQYFPNVDYLIQVLEGAMQTVAPGGVLFIGDVRSLPLLTAFHAEVQFAQAEPEMARSQLRQRVEKSRFEEPELVIDPTFFHALRMRFPQIAQVKIRLTRGHSQNEMTQFRYNVLLCMETDSINQKDNLASIEWIDWRQKPVTVADIKDSLLNNQLEIVGITNIANSRVYDAVKIADWLFSTPEPKTVERMREALQNPSEAIHPQVWWDLEAVLPYTVEISWSAQTQTGAYDVVLIRHGVTAPAKLFTSASLEPSQQAFWNQYANNPLQPQLARRLIPEFRQSLAQALPDYMLPAAFVPLETLPLTSNGKLDRRALPLPDADAIYLTNPPTLLESDRISQSQTELTLIEIWKELLRLKQVNVQHNFFELGGHSLLATQMASRVRDAFGVEIPLRSVFEAPTITQLAPVIDALRETAPLQVPSLVRLDRMAHRQLQSDLQEVSTAASSSASSSASSKSWSPLVPLTIGGTQSPFFCVHPMFGVVFPYLELAHHLGDNRSFYGLQPQGLDGEHSPFNRIEDMAAYYIRAMQTVQPRGPYYLGGWSFGGLVAYEMAQQLSQIGQQIKLLAILDTPAPVASNQPSLGQSLKYLLKTAIWSTLPFVIDYSAIVTNRSAPSRSESPHRDWVSRWKWSAITRLIPEESRLRLLDESAIGPLLRIFYANSQAAFRYVPQPYAGQLTLFKTTESNPLADQALMLGWDQLASNIQLHSVSGNHLSMLKQPHVENLAEQLRQYFL